MPNPVFSDAKAVDSGNEFYKAVTAEIIKSYPNANVEGGNLAAKHRVYDRFAILQAQASIAAAKIGALTLDPTKAKPRYRSSSTGTTSQLQSWSDLYTKYLNGKDVPGAVGTSISDDKPFLSFYEKIHSWLIFPSETTGEPNWTALTHDKIHTVADAKTNEALRWRAIFDAIDYSSRKSLARR